MHIVNLLHKSVKYYAYILFFLVALILVQSFFSGLNSNELLFIGDQFYRVSYSETYVNSFVKRKFDDLNIHNSYQFIVQFWDTLYFLIAYSLQVPFIEVEKILFLLIIYFSLVLSYKGFKTFTSFNNLYVSDGVLILITLWYCFNPYTLVLWHGGVYNIGSGLTYSLAPLLITYFHELFRAKKTAKFLVKTALLLFVMSFNFWMFATLVVGIFIYTIVYLMLNLKQFSFFLLNGLKLFILCLPLLVFLGFNTIDETLSKSQDINYVHLPTFGNQQGGLIYQFLMRFSWGIYTKWEPRSMYSFSGWFFSQTYVIATIAVYGIIVVGMLLPIIKRKKPTVSTPSTQMLNTKSLTAFLTVLILGLFLANGSQPPLGNVFMFLYNKVPFFSIFRSADYRFGFIIVLAIAFLLIMLVKSYKKNIFVGIFGVILIIHSSLFLSGIAIKGENIADINYDRVVTVPDDYQQVIDYINSTPKPFGYILPLPPIEYGHYALPNGGHHIGQDLLSKFINQPFFYVSASSGIATKTYNDVDELITNKHYEGLKKFPINYLLIRNDLSCDYCSNIEASLGTDFVKVFSNTTFQLYEVNNATSLFSGASIKYKVISPVKYQIYIKGLTKLSPTELKFLVSYNNNWHIYPLNISDFTCNSEFKAIGDSINCQTDYKMLDVSDINYAFNQPLFNNVHTIADNYANAWTISFSDISGKKPLFDAIRENSDGSFDIALTVYYIGQSFFTITLVISFSFAFLYSVYLIVPASVIKYRRMLQ